MHLNAHERQIYYTLWVFSIVEDLLSYLMISSPQFEDPQSALPLSIDAGDVRSIRNVWSSVQRASQQLIGIDRRRRLWTDAVGCLRCQEAADFHELHRAIMAHVTSGRWAPDFCKEVLAELRDIAVTSPPADFAAWQRRTVAKRAQVNPLMSPGTDEPPGA